jgi:hypothetical protein
VPAPDAEAEFAPNKGETSNEGKNMIADMADVAADDGAADADDPVVVAVSAGLLLMLLPRLPAPAIILWLLLLCMLVVVVGAAPGLSDVVGSVRSIKNGNSTFPL